MRVPPRDVVHRTGLLLVCSAFVGMAAAPGHCAAAELLVSAQLADGSIRDITPQSRFASSDPKVAHVTDSGLIQPVANGTATITVTAGDQQASTTVRVTRFDDLSYNFSSHILPVLSRLSCNQMGCHGSPKGKNGFRLSLFGADPRADYESISRESMGRLVTPMDPADSLLLQKATAAVSHGGGKRTSPDSPEYKLLADWIAHGAPRGSDKDPTLVRIEVFPRQRVLQRDDRQPLLVEAYYSDGSMCDEDRGRNIRLLPFGTSVASGELLRELT